MYTILVHTYTCREHWSYKYVYLGADFTTHEYEQLDYTTLPHHSTSIL